MSKKLFIYALIGLAGFGLVSCNKQEEKSVMVPSQTAQNNLKIAEDFLHQNSSKDGVITTKSGLQYKVITAGNPKGEKPSFNSEVRVHYEGKLLDESVFDSSFARGEPQQFPVGRLIPAWTEALQLMRPGDEWLIWVHPKIGYGDMGMPAGCDVYDMKCEIPPNSLLIFRMKLESIVNSSDNSQEPIINSQ